MEEKYEIVKDILTNQNLITFGSILFISIGISGLIYVDILKKEEKNNGCS